MTKQMRKARRYYRRTHTDSRYQDLFDRMRSDPEYGVKKTITICGVDLSELEREEDNGHSDEEG